MAHRTPLPLALLALLALTAPRPGCGGGPLMELARAADQLAEAGRHADAVGKYRAALGSGLVEHAEVVAFNLGLSLVELRRHSEAAAAFESTLEALRVLPERHRHRQPARAGSVHVAAAEALTHAPADWGSAARHFGAAAALDPADAMSRYNAGSALFNLRRQLLHNGVSSCRATASSGIGVPRNRARN
jgi:tetratricopeptide (TPR) repeat protein